MKIKMKFVLGIALFFILINTCLVFSQELATDKPAAQESPSEADTQWIWGDVVSVDAATKKILVKYLDYETENEKEINIEVDDKTTYENVKSVDEIKPLDTLSIDYIINPDDRNIAKNISVERPESVPTLPQEGIKEEPSGAPGLE